MTTQYSNLFNSINRIVPTIEGQITGIFSFSIFTSILSLGNVTLIGVIFVVVALFFIIADNQIRKLIRNTSDHERNKNWLIVVDFILDDFYRFYIFIIIQYIDLIIRNNFFGNKQSLLEQLVLIFVIGSVLTFVIVLIENFQRSENTESAAVVFLRVWNGIYSTIIQFFSLFVFKEIKELPNQSQMGIILLTVFVFYMIFEWVIRKLTHYMEKSENYERNALWYKWINKFLDSLVMFSFFFVIRYIGDFIGDMSSSNRLSVFGRFVVLFIVYVITYTIFGIIIHFSELGMTDSVFVGTFARLWYKISGTTTGLFSIIITEEVFVGTQKNQLLMTLIAILIFYSSMDYFVRKLVNASSSVKENPQWASIVTQLLDFPLALTPILIFDVITNYLNSTLSNNPELVFTHILIVVILQILATSIFTLLKYNGFY